MIELTLPRRAFYATWLLLHSVIALLTAWLLLLVVGALTGVHLLLAWSIIYLGRIVVRLDWKRR